MAIRLEKAVQESRVATETLKLVIPIFSIRTFPDVALLSTGEKSPGDGFCKVTGEKRFTIDYSPSIDPMLTPAVILHEVGETIEDMVRKITDLESLPIPSLFSHELADLFACYVLDGELFRRQTGVKHKNAYIRLKKLLLTQEFSSEDLETLRGAIQLERSDREASVGTFLLGEIDVIRRLAPWKYDENYSPKPLYLRTIQHK